ncbi:MAG TPA: hypothetical protein VL523_08815 [Terriglobia bacterium]|nr:hypothetical protein [Terriglobia bacterium]
MAASPAGLAAAADCKEGLQVPGGGDPAAISPLELRYQGITGAQIFAELLAHNRLRDAHLQHYSAVRTYSVCNDKSKLYAEEVVTVNYQAPGRKTFVTDSENGSRIVRDLVLKPLMASETETASGQGHRDSSIIPANYSFEVAGEQDLGPYHCFVVEATPARKDKYLFRGRIWLDRADYGIVRIAGSPAKSLSFWIKRAEFVRQYQKIGEFWLPARDETVVAIRLYGKKLLTIDYQNYAIGGGAGSSP